MLAAGPAAADSILLEDFDAEFPAWEKGWLGTNSNLENFYGVGAGRGDNPDGLYLDDGDRLKYDSDVAIVFDSAFGALLSQLSFDLAGSKPATLVFFDSFGNKLLIEEIGGDGAPAKGGPGTYQKFSVKSDTGIGGFSFVSTAGNLEGNLSIDNVKAKVDQPTRVPEPSSLMLFGAGIVGLVVRGRRLRRHSMR